MAKEPRSRKKLPVECLLMRSYCRAVTRDVEAVKRRLLGRSPPLLLTSLERARARSQPPDRPRPPVLTCLALSLQGRPTPSSRLASTGQRPLLRSRAIARARGFAGQVDRWRGGGYRIKNLNETARRPLLQPSQP